MAKKALKSSGDGSMAAKQPLATSLVPSFPGHRCSHTVSGQHDLARQGKDQSALNLNRNPSKLCAKALEVLAAFNARELPVGCGALAAFCSTCEERHQREPAKATGFRP